MTWIQTYTGRAFDLFEPQFDQVCIDDIAHSLAMQCRFNGHCNCFYSVAEHSIHVSNLLPPALRVHGLLHDAAEAYLGDIVRPLKRGLARVITGDFGVLVKNIAMYEAVIQGVILQSLLSNPVITPIDLAAIKHADNVMLATEARDLMAEPPRPWEALPPPREARIDRPMLPAQAKAAFIKVFAEAAA